MGRSRTAFLHYTAPPVVGGVEAVMEAHAATFLDAGYPVKVISGRGELSAFPKGVELTVIPEIDTQHPAILEMNGALETGQVPEQFLPLRDRLAGQLREELRGNDLVIVHNVFTKHFNLPLTAALFQLLDQGQAGRCLAWCHDFTWTSPNSRSRVFPGYPWDLLRTWRPDVRYVTVSEKRRQELAGLLRRPAEDIDVIYNGVDPPAWFGLTAEGWSLARRMDLLSGDLILVMPLRVTRAKNIELAARVVSALKQLDCSPRMVITGPPDPHSEESMSYFQNLLDLRAELGLEQEMRFVFESGEEPGEPYTVPIRVVADLLRLSDVVFMPSHREGFGMPVLEAGLVGVPVVASEHVPAAQEIGGSNVHLFAPPGDPDEIARMILDEVVENRTSRLRRLVRQNFTWERIFQRKIEPYLRGEMR